MENNDIKELVSSFKEYRDLLTPIEQNLRDFSTTYERMKEDINNLNSAFGGDIQGKLDKIYKTLAEQSSKSKDLAAQIEIFTNKTDAYIKAADKMLEVFTSLTDKINAINNIEKNAEEQMAKLNNIIEEKKKSYDVKELQKNLEVYNQNVQKISEYINKDVALALKNNSDEIKNIRDKNESVLETLLEQKSSISDLVNVYNSTNDTLKKIVEKQDVNQEYIYEILDKWANDRNVKMKK